MAGVAATPADVRISTTNTTIFTTVTLPGDLADGVGTDGDSWSLYVQEGIPAITGAPAPQPMRTG